MDTQHPLYYHSQYNPSYERYGLLQQRTNSFYIIDNDPELLKSVQLTIMKYEFLHFVNIDHFFTFLNKTQQTIDKYQIKSVIDAHKDHIKKAAIFKNDELRIEQIQKSINNDNCFLFGMTGSTARSMPMDVSHFRLVDNIIKRHEKDRIFSNDLQEKLFLIRRLLYVLKGVFEYVIQFVTLQEKIGDFGLEVYEKHFSMCNPEDTIIPKMVKEEIEANQRRIRSIKEFYKTLYKGLNKINFDQPIKEIILQFRLNVRSEDSILETIKNYPMFHRTYDFHKIINILEKEANTLLKYYEQHNS